MIPQPIDTIPLFQRLSGEERQLLISRLKRRHVESGELVVAEGQPAESLFIITTGWVKLEGGRATLANLGPGSLLGEVDMLMRRPYSMTARSAAATQLLVLSHNDLQELINERPSIGLKFSASIGVRIAFLEKYLVQQRLRNIELLSALSEQDLRAIAQRLDFRAVSRGDVITEAGADGDAAFFIEEGKIRLITKSNDGESFEDLESGAMFGHTSLLTGKAYASTARVIADGTVWVLPRDEYQSLLRQHPAVKLAMSRALAEALSEKDQTDASERMRQLQLFSDVPSDGLSALASRLVLRHFPADEVIYTSGTPGDAMYIVESGEVRLTDGLTSTAQLIERMRAGDSFGDMALLTGRTRSEYARAATDTTIWVLYKTDFDDVMVQYPSVSVSLSRALTERLTTRESDLVIRHLRRMDLLSSLAASELKVVSDRVRGIRFRPGEMICFAGEPAQALFMIAGGQIKRTGSDAYGESSAEILDVGASFGEKDLVQNRPYSVTAQALTDTELWTIAKVDFLALMEQFPSLALTVTRLMADQPARSQGYQQPPMPPRGGSSMPPVPPAAPRVQRPPSGARPIQTATQAPSASKPERLIQQSAPVRPTAPIAQPEPRAARTPTPKPAPQPKPIAAPRPTPQPKPVAAPRPTPQARPMQSKLPTDQPRTPRKQSSFFSELGAWMGNLSAGGKLRALTLGLLALWFLVIVGPWTTVTTVSSAVGGLQLTNAPANNPSKPAIAAPDTSNNNRVKVANAVEPTATPQPTRTPAPTFTPRPKVVAVVATKTPAPAVAPVVAAPVAPPLPPREIDPRLVAGSGKTLPIVDQFKIIPATVGHGQKFWRVTKVVFQDISESGNDHTIYVMLLDENGKRAEAKLKAVGEGSGEMPPESIPQKSADDMCQCNYGVFMYGDGYTVQVVDQYPSDQAGGMVMPMRRHVVYKVWYQLVTNP